MSRTKTSGIVAFDAHGKTTIGAELIESGGHIIEPMEDEKILNNE